MFEARAAEIISFSFDGIATGIINEDAKTISVTLPLGIGISIASLPAPTIIYRGASISPLSDVPQNFIEPVTYTVKSQDGKKTATYTVNVSGEEPIYTVTFNSNSGSTVAAYTDVPQGTTIDSPTPPTLANYIFQGWYKEAGFTNRWNFATDTVTDNITLYARWIHEDELAEGDIGPGGGIIFYYDPVGFTVKGHISYGGEYTANYLEAAPADGDFPSYAWARSTTTPSNNNIGTEDGIGKGRWNTTLIRQQVSNPANDTPAANACATYNGGGVSDWFLPSREELQILGGFLSTNTTFRDTFFNAAYWSSTETAANAAGRYNLVTNSSASAGTKTTTNRVRPIRAF